MNTLAQSYKVIKTTKTSFSYIEFWENDIVYISFNEGADILVDDIKELRQVVLDFLGDKPFYVLQDDKNNYTVAKEAYEYGARNLFANRKAVARLVRSLASRLFL